MLNIKDKDNVKETTAIYKQLKDITIAEHYFTEEEINGIVGKINDEIQYYIERYKKRPQMIMISQILEVFMRKKIDIMHHNQIIMLNNNELRVSFIFGIPVLTTPVLDGLEFEIR
jgi:hypothetical protein